MAYPDARNYLLGEEGAREVPYRETEHYLVTRGFLANPERTLNELLSEDEPADAGIEEARKLMAELGITPAQLVEGAYVDLLARQRAER